jgi:hypothetical protein
MRGTKVYVVLYRQDPDHQKQVWGIYLDVYDAYKAEDNLRAANSDALVDVVEHKIS